MSEVLHIRELAEILDTSEAAIRGHIARRTNAIPQWLWMGKRVAWRKETVSRWLEEQEQKAQNERVVRPARRRLGGNTSKAS